MIFVDKSGVERPAAFLAAAAKERENFDRYYALKQHAGYPFAAYRDKSLKAAIGDGREPERSDSFHEMKRGLDESAHENPCTLTLLV